MIEQKVRGKTCSSGLGSERIKQMEAAQAILEKTKQRHTTRNGYGTKFGYGTGAIGAVDSMFVEGPKEFGENQGKRGKKKREINMIDYDRAIYFYQLNKNKNHRDYSEQLGPIGPPGGGEEEGD